MKIIVHLILHFPQFIQIGTSSPFNIRLTQNFEVSTTWEIYEIWIRNPKIVINDKLALFVYSIFTNTQLRILSIKLATIVLVKGFASLYFILMIYNNILSLKLMLFSWKFPCINKMYQLIIRELIKSKILLQTCIYILIFLNDD